MSATHFWLIRHGETAWNAERRLQGWRDVPLNDVGVEQARRLGEHLRSGLFDHAVEVIVSSDLGRAYETARLAAGHFELPIASNPALRERSYGVYEGRDWKELSGAGLSGDAAINFRDPHHVVEQGETQHMFEVRVTQAFEALAREHRGRKVMVFSHGGVIDVIWRKINHMAADAPRLTAILNTSINQFSVQDGLWQAHSWGQVEHLQVSALDDIG
jgi:probable phosphoglycerate mutase